MEKIQYVLVMGFVFCLICGQANAASFNCAKATSKIEKAICNNPELNDADTRMGQVYTQLRKSLSKSAKQQLKKEQLTWLKQRNQNCSVDDINCLLALYKSHIAALNSKFPTSSVVGNELNGVYEHSHKIDYFDGKKWIQENVEDCLSIEILDKKRLKFSFVIVGSNLHTCSMEGIAVLEGSSYVYREKTENSSDCVIRIKILEDRILLEEDQTFKCSIYCGMKARIDKNEFLFRNKSKAKKCGLE